MSAVSSGNKREPQPDEVELDGSGDEFEDADAGDGAATPTEVINAAEETGEAETDQGKLKALLGILRKVIGVKVGCLLHYLPGHSFAQLWFQAG
jgi:hypothetical protein